jgi:predicted alpha/beta superfamily hydrolase
MKPPPITKTKPAFVSFSKETRSEYYIYVDTPEKAPARAASRGVLVMDGDFFFDPAVQATRALSAAGRIPPTLIIGVGYGVGFGKPGNFRGRDYTPTAAPDEPSSGGADRFLDYLTDTLWPELARRYHLREKGHAIAGHSLGSLLVLHALFQARPFFDMALASAPSIWWDNRSVLGLIAKLRARQKSLAASLYLGVGENDSPSMSSDLGLLEKQLKDFPFKGLRVVSEVFPGRDHYDVLPFTLSAGLACLLGKD